MIYDSIKNYNRYKGIHKNIDVALDFIFENKNKIYLSDESHQIIPSSVIGHILKRETKIDALMEHHQKYMDVHFIINGSETVELYDTLPTNYDYDEKTDNAFYEVNSTNKLIINQGEFYMVWPYELHKPLCAVNNNVDIVEKIICKVLID